MKRHFIDLLVCPDCSGPVQFDDQFEGDDIDRGSMTCSTGHTFEIVRGIPRFVSGDTYADNFGFEWNRHSQTQLDDASSDESEQTFIAKTGFTPEELHGKLVLDVGCGMGRFSDVVSRWGASVVGVDLSSAVDAAANNLGMRDEVLLAQADIFKLPFAEATFDFVFSIGVLHHTPDTRAAFDQLPRLLKPGGKIAIWVYSEAMRQWCWTSDFYRRVTTRMPRRMLYALCHAAVPMYYIHRAPIVGQVSRVMLPMSVHPNAEWRVLDTFDWYSPKYQWKHATSELHGWFTQHGLTELMPLGTPTSMQGKRARTNN